MKNLQLLIALVALIGLSACGSDDDNKRVAPVDPEADPTCAFAIDDGQAHLGLFSEDIQISFFDKPFNANHLKSVQMASMANTIDFIQQTGVNLYKAPAKGRSKCNYLASLSLPPDQILKLWKENTGDDGDGQYTLGIFYPSSKLEKSEAADPNAIVLRSNIDKWTLVHEFMHHNYYETAQSLTGYDDVAAIDAIKKSNEKFNAALDKDLRKEENFAELTETLKERIEAMKRYWKHFTFEEIAIEGQLLALYKEELFQQGTDQASTIGKTKPISSSAIRYQSRYQSTISSFSR